MSTNIDHNSKAKAIIDSFTASFPDVPIRYFKKANKIGEFCQISASKNFEFGDIIPIVKIETSTKPNTTVHAKLRVNDDYYNIFNTMIEKNIFDNNTGDFNFVVETFDDSQGYTHINFVLMSKPNVTIINAFRKINDIMIPQITKMIKHYAEVVIPEQAASYTATNADFPALPTSTNNTTKATTTWSPVIPKDTTPAEPVATAAEQPKDDFPPLVIKQEAAPVAEPVAAPVSAPVAPVAAVATIAKGTTTPPPTRAFTPVQSVPATQNAVITPVQSPIVTHASNPQKQLFPRPPLMHQPQYPFLPIPMCQPSFMPFNGISKESLDAEQMQIADMEMRIVAMQKELEFMTRAHSLNIAHYNRIVALRQDSDSNPHAWQEVTIEQ
jgi:hypothetical protein